MNNIHKIIFNKSTQQYVVVSELAKSAGKAKAISADTLDLSLLLQNFSEKRPLVDFLLNRQVAQPKDINQVLQEQQVFNQSIGNMQEAANTYAEQKAKVAAEAVNKAEEALQAAEKSGDIAKINEKQTAYAEAKAQAERWEDGGANKRNVDAAVATIGTILSGGNAGQTAVAVLSPELNAQIHELTKDNQTANLLAHAALSAVEAKASGTNAAAGAIAGAAGEATAMLLAEAVFNKQPNELTTEERNLLKVAGQLAGAVSGNLASSTTADAVIGAETAKRAVENNYLTSNEALKFEKELVECRKNNQDCSPIIQKYLDISNKRSQKLVDKCSDGGIRCAGMEEIIDAHTNVARVKNDTTGRIYLGTPLQDDEAIKFVSYLNNRDLSYLHNNVSTMDRALYYGADPTNWPFLLMGGRGLLTNNSKSALLSTTAAMSINAGGQYALTGDVNIPDLIMTGVIAKSTVNKGLTQTVNTNTLGSYYSSQINNNDNPALWTLYSGAASGAGYKVTESIGNKLNPIFNPNYKKYEWKDTGYLGISYQPNPSNIPQMLGTVGGSLTYEFMNNRLPKVEFSGEKSNESKK